MAGCLPDEPPPRWGHFSAAVEGYLYVWGGRTGDYAENQAELVNSVYRFDPFLEDWKKYTCSGATPPGLYNGACASAGQKIYVYGGRDGGRDGSGYHKSLHQLDTKTWIWEELDKGGPAMRKIGSGMVVFKDKLILFGGCGFSSGCGPKYQGRNGGQTSSPVNVDEPMWTNELHTFDLEKKIWSAVTCGNAPPPIRNFNLTMIDDSTALLFGGTHPGDGSLDHVYKLDLSKMVWSKIAHQPRNCCPVKRSRHAAVHLGGDHPQLLVIGGFSTDGNVRSDIWTLDLKSERWKEVPCNSSLLKVEVPSLQPRCYHSATAFTLSPGVTEVVVFGGCPKWPIGNDQSDANFPMTANTTVLQFEERNDKVTGKEWVLTYVANNTQLGRTRAKMLTLKRMQECSVEKAVKRARLATNASGSSSRVESDFQNFISQTLPDEAILFLQNQLDRDSEVDKDLSEIAEHMVEWENISPKLELSGSEVHDIKEKYQKQPELQRREALRVWKNKKALVNEATYENLLKLFWNARYSKCVQSVCAVLEQKLLKSKNCTHRH